MVAVRSQRTATRLTRTRPLYADVGDLLEQNRDHDCLRHHTYPAMPRAPDSANFGVRFENFTGAFSELCPNGAAQSEEFQRDAQISGFDWIISRWGH
jgi:hypothetical protein